MKIIDHKTIRKTVYGPFTFKELEPIINTMSNEKQVNEYVLIGLIKMSNLQITNNHIILIIKLLSISPIHIDIKKIGNGKQ